MQAGIQGKKQAKDRIFALLREKHVLTRQDIASGLGLSMPTTLQNVTDLLEIGVLRECVLRNRTEDAKRRDFA